MSSSITAAPPLVAATSHGKTLLSRDRKVLFSEIYPTYGYNGRENMGTWIEAAAKKKQADDRIMKRESNCLTPWLG